MKKSVSKDTKLLAYLFLINCILFPVLYFVAANAGFDWILIIYTALAVGFGFTYFIYNKGFSGKNVTSEMLPDSMSYTDKLHFIEESKRRLAASRWMLTVIFPSVFSIALDIMYLFLLPMLKEMLA